LKNELRFYAQVAFWFIVRSGYIDQDNLKIQIKSFAPLSRKNCSPYNLLNDRMVICTGYYHLKGRQTLNVRYISFHESQIIS
jgi:hypothetical protein